MDKKEAIFQHTLLLIHQNGFHGTPMSQIAQRSGVAIGTIYHHFESKDELILALFKYCRGLITEYIFKDNHPDIDFKTRFFSIWLNFVEFYIKHPESLSFMDQFYSSPYLQRVLIEETMCGEDSVSRFLKEGIDLGFIRNADVNIISTVFIGTAVSTVKRHLHGLHRFNQESFRHIIEIIWDGIKK
ncbi:TetR/AcrR family transcriptional regulator [Pseudopedobacter sp.]|uniref:TetR/AcrR family transcriptional regulator n=1 Tax=Pseudopedobacter sp. TaxID=1936787 RepID=UPI0033404824